MKQIVYSLIAVVLLAGCNKVKSVQEDTTEETTVVEEAPVAYSMMDVDASKEQAAPAENAISQKVIKNADLRFETDDLVATAERIQTAVKKQGAQVQHDSEGKDGYSINRRMTVRIPATRFEAFIADIGKGVSYFDRKEISSTDVTEEYIDLEARVKAKKVLEARYLDLIGKAKKVSEILEIEKELSAIREEIEAKEGQLRYLKNRVALSTVNIEFYKTTASAPDATVSYGSKMLNALKSGFNALSSFFIGLLYIWPFILIFVIAFFIVRKKLKKRKNNHDVPN
jgi:uncharacterized protein YceK